MTTITVTPAAESKPHQLSAAVIITDVEAYRAAIAESGAGLRTGGERKGIQLRYGVLDSASEEFLLEALRADESIFSAPVGVANGDEVGIRARATKESGGSCSAHVLPRGSDDRIQSLDLGIVAKPSNGALLPVIRGQIPITGSGTYLISFESGTGDAFAAFLRLEVDGAIRATGTRARRNHNLSVRSFIVKTGSLSRILRLEGIEERGGLGGIGIETLDRSEAEAVASALGEEATPGPRTDQVIEAASETTIRAGGLSLLVSSTFAPSVANYSTTLTVNNRGTLPPIAVTHGDQEVLLLLGWDAESPGTSTAALIELSPAD